MSCWFAAFFLAASNILEGIAVVIQSSHINNRTCGLVIEADWLSQWLATPSHRDAAPKTNLATVTDSLTTQCANICDVVSSAHRTSVVGSL